MTDHCVRRRGSPPVNIDEAYSAAKASVLGELLAAAQQCNKVA